MFSIRLTLPIFKITPYILEPKNQCWLSVDWEALHFSASVLLFSLIILLDQLFVRFLSMASCSCFNTLNPLLLKIATVFPVVCARIADLAFMIDSLATVATSSWCGFCVNVRCDSHREHNKSSCLWLDHNIACRAQYPSTVRIIHQRRCPVCVCMCVLLYLLFYW